MPARPHRLVVAAAALAACAVPALASARVPLATNGVFRGDPGDVPSLSAADGDGLPPFVPEMADVPDELPGDIVVDLKDDVSPADIAAMEREFGIDLVSASAYSDEVDKLELAHVDVGAQAGLLDRLAKDGRVEVAEPLVILRASFQPNDPLYTSKQWHLKRVGAERAWEYACGSGITVAVVDTGIACFDKGPFARGTDLAGTRCAGGYDFVRNRGEASDDQGHGTHVAGTIAQTTHNGVGTAGLAFCATLMPVKVLNRWGWGTSAGVAQGIRYAADHGAQIINLSLGGNQPSGVIERAVKHAQKKGALVVAAAGNSGRNVGWPAAYPGVLAVSATDSEDKIAWFSSRGPEVGIAAPGVDVTQQTVCDGGRNRCEIFGTYSGTSMASPHVAGAAALVMSVGVTDPDAVKAALTSSATAKDDASLYGAGVLRAGDAVLHAVYTRLALRLGALFVLGWLVARRIRSRGGRMVRGGGFWAGAMLGAAGLLPVAPLLTLLTRAGALRPYAELLARPVAEWSLFFGAGVHRWLPFANALPALGLAAVLFGARRFRPMVGGFALGSAAVLAQLAVAADVAFPLGAVLLRTWAVANGLVCLWLSRVVTDEKG